ncbi:MAG: hypothetical protein PHS41_08400 [Victivallaceae bacterium]|nr:hypothetical protein [Victivallaceae bacterium]
MTIDYAEVERSLVDFLQSKLDLAADDMLFSGDLPAGREGLAVKLEQLGAKTNPSELAECTIRICLRMKSRPQLLTWTKQLSALFPCYGVCRGETEFVSLRQSSGMPPETVSESGQRQYATSLLLAAAIRTAAN